MTRENTPIYATVLTDVGGRRTNEDSVYDCQAIEPHKAAARGRLYIVADGTGGQEGGQTASSMAAAIISEHYYDDTSPDLGESLRTAISTAHSALYELARTVSSWTEMSTTIVAAVVHEGTLYVAYVGDSRAYLVRDGKARLLTRDHIWLKDDENYGALMRWLGGAGKAMAEVDLLTETLRDNDTVILCSDGLTDVVDNTDIATLASESAPKAASKRLVEMANRRGTGDNVSVAAIRYGGKAPANASKRWVWLGGGAAALAVVAILIIVLSGTKTGGGNGADSAAGTPAVTTAQVSPSPTKQQYLEDNEAPAPPTETQPAAPATTEPTRRSTSTPKPPTDTPTPRPTLRPTNTPEPSPTLSPQPTPEPQESGGGDGGGDDSKPVPR